MEKMIHGDVTCGDLDAAVEEAEVRDLSKTCEISGEAAIENREQREQRRGQRQ